MWCHLATSLLDMNIHDSILLTVAVSQSVSVAYSEWLEQKDNFGYDGAYERDMRNIFRKRRMSCNVVIVGERGVGKTAMVNRFIHDSFSKVS